MPKDTPNSSNPDPDSGDESLADAFARRLAQVEHTSQIAQAQARAASEVATARAWDLGSVVRTVMREAVYLGEFEQEMATRHPEAAGPLRLLGDVAVMCLGEFIRATGREMVGYAAEVTP
jgi:hypothetical protein